MSDIGNAAANMLFGSWPSQSEHHRSQSNWGVKFEREVVLSKEQIASMIEGRPVHVNVGAWHDGTPAFIKLEMK